MVEHVAPTVMAASPSVRVGRLCARVVALLILGAATAVLAQTAPSSRNLVGTTFSAVVTSIVDGDTVHVEAPNRRTLIVRLDGIDTPERGEPFSAQATRATRVMLFTNKVTLTGTDVDRYGRLVARVHVGGVDVSEALVRQGLACHFTRYSSDPVLARAQLDAQRWAIGFWAPGAQRPSCANGVRASTPSSSAKGPFHGNTSSRVFHAPTCKNYNCRNCTIEFETADAARAAGFKPAGDCLR